MSRKTNNYNAYESSTIGPLAIGALSVAVDSAAGLVADIYLVIDPDNPLKREWIKVNDINGNTLNIETRNLPGSVGDVQHDAGAKVRSVPTKQIFDDLFLDIEDNLDLFNGHLVAANPHAIYLTELEADAIYLQLVGGTLTGALTLPFDPTANLHAATKQYVDAEVLGVDHATPIATHASDVSAHHVKYTDQEAIDAVGAVPPGQTFLHSDLTDVTADQHHTKYTDAEARATIATEDLYYTKAEVNSLLADKAEVSHTHPASQITPGSFPTGAYTFLGTVGIAGAFNANSSVDFSGLPINAGGVDLRINGNSVTRAS